MDLNNKTIVVYCPILEFHAFIKCNLFLAELRKRYEPIKIVCSIPEKALGVLSEADEILVCSSEQLDKENANVPQVLDTLGSRDNSSRYSRTVEFVEKNYKDFVLLRYDELDIPSLAWFGPVDLADSFRRDFGWLCSYLSSGNCLMPTKKAYENMKSKYGSIFNEKTYIIVTRNFASKQPAYNTLAMVPQLTELAPVLINNGIKIVNIGFPPGKLHGNHENYVELSESLTYDELMALFYLSSGVILSGENGGFTVHASTLNDIFLIREEWSVVRFRNDEHPGIEDPRYRKRHPTDYSLEAARNKSNKTTTYNLIGEIGTEPSKEVPPKVEGSIDKILQVFLNHSKKLTQKFNEDDVNVIYLD